MLGRSRAVLPQVLEFRLLADRAPILFLHIGIDLDHAAVETILPVPLGSGNPVALSRLHVEVVGFVAGSAESLKPLATEVDGAAALGECDARDPTWSRQALSFVFHVHDPRFHHDTSWLRPN